MKNKQVMRSEMKMQAGKTWAIMADACTLKRTMSDDFRRNFIVIKGYLTNNGETTQDSVLVEAEFCDEKGTKVGSSHDVIHSLGPGQTGQFLIKTFGHELMGDACHYVVNVSRKMPDGGGKKYGE